MAGTVKKLPAYAEATRRLGLITGVKKTPLEEEKWLHSGAQQES